MKLVVDANIIFAALIRDSHTRRMLLAPDNELYAPEYMILEVKEHFETLKEKTGLTEEELDALVDGIAKMADIKIINPQEFKDKLQGADSISPDPDDIQYFALALKLNCPIWSNDKKLKEQKKVKIISTEELPRNPRF
ncbi:MAG TPA: PIN domain-containing protein [Candidatus Nanoarchaeia archaeon]|nr:PIN domain-containing protein [Candidatus Nanoarchaeia archaeon]